MNSRDSAPTKRIFSGIQPTGDFHLGNYLGAIRNWARLQDEYQSIYCMVDLHAITTFQNPAELTANIRTGAANLIACGIDPEKSIVFNQSRVAGHGQLAWIFNCVTRLGWLNRMTQFKEKAGKHKEKASVGLYVYPTLMAADILLYRTTHVPVGEDQKQHLELTRDIAQKFNSDFGLDYFTLPEPLIYGGATRVMSLRDGRNKMSKSDPSDQSRINISDSADQIARKIRKAKTDPLPLPSTEEGLEDRPEADNLLTIYAALADISRADACRRFGDSKFSVFKEELAELAVEKLGPIAAEARRLLEDTSYIDQILRDGAERAEAIAIPVLAEIHQIVGLLRP